MRATIVQGTWRLLATLLVLLPATTARAQKAPEVGYAFPAGGKAGTTVEVRLGGYDWTPDLQFFSLEPKVQLSATGAPGAVLVTEPPYWFGSKALSPPPPLPREVPAQFVLPAGLPPGPVRWQVANANGASATGVFLVGDGPEVVEDEHREAPQVLPGLPVTVSGRLIKIEDVDRYQFQTLRAGPVTCDLMARRLGSNFHGVLEVRRLDGRVVADAVDSTGGDTSLTFAAEAGSQYQIRVHDLDFRGDWSYVYRLNIHPGPRVVAALPSAGRRGQTRPVEFIGIGLATGAAKLESVTRSVAFPADPTATVHPYRLETPFGIAPTFPLLFSDLPEHVEPSDPPPSARPLEVPVAITGTLDARGVEDRYAIQGRNGDVWAVSLEAQRIGSPLDVTLSVSGPDGKERAKNDDLPGTTDAGLTFTVPADGVYTLVVTDVSGKSGSRDAGYRLVVERPASDFDLQTAQRIAVPIGGGAEWQVIAVRKGAFKEPIELTVAGLPPGVSVPAGLVIKPDQNELKIAVKAAQDAPSAAALAIVTGTAKIEGRSVTRIARAMAAGNLAPRSPRENEVGVVLVATTMKPGFKLRPVDKDGGRTVHRGTTFPAEVIVERTDGFQGPITLQMSAQQDRHRQGITGPEVVVPPGVGRIAYPCFMPEWLETSRTSRMMLIGAAQVPDPCGRIRHLVAAMDGRITMSMEGALLKVAHAAGELTARPGQSFVVPVRILRSAKLAEPVRLELRLEHDQAGLFRANPVVVAPNQGEAPFAIQAASDSRLSGDFALTIRGTALPPPGNLPVISETRVPITFTPAVGAH